MSPNTFILSVVMVFLSGGVIVHYINQRYPDPCTESFEVISANTYMKTCSGGARAVVTARTDSLYEFRCVCSVGEKP